MTGPPESFAVPQVQPHRVMLSRQGFASSVLLCMTHHMVPGTLLSSVPELGITPRDLMSEV